VTGKHRFFHHRELGRLRHIQEILILSEKAVVDLLTFFAVQIEELPCLHTLLVPKTWQTRLE